MTVLPLKYAPESVLRRKAKRVSKIDASVQRLIDDLIETMYAEEGIGLAANQVGVPLRVLVMGIPYQDPDTEEVYREEYVLVNPEFVKKGGERLVSEGCLSIPGYRGKLNRAEWVKVKGRDREGKAVRLKADGIMAQALEHEIDHLDGVLYVDRMKEQGTLDTLAPIEKEESEESEALREVYGEAPAA